GLAVHTTARVCSAAHGGQIVVSAATRAAVGASASTGIRFRDLGRHRLAGLPDAEALFQIQAQGLRVKFARPRLGRRSTSRRRSGPAPSAHAGNSLDWIARLASETANRLLSVATTIASGDCAT